MKKPEREPSKAEVNRNTGKLVMDLENIHWQDSEILGRKIRSALKAALKATVMGKQSDKHIEKELDKAQYALNRYLTRATN